MTCYRSSINPVPICGGPAILICVQAAADAFPQPAWVSAVCTEGEVDSFALFSDAELAVPLVGYTIGDRVRCPESLVGATCETAMSTNLCPATLDAINQIIDDQTASIVAAIDAVTAELVIANREYSYGDYVYDANGNLVSITRHFPGEPSQTKTYVYDGLLLVAESEWIDEVIYEVMLRMLADTSFDTTLRVAGFVTPGGTGKIVWGDGTPDTVIDSSATEWEHIYAGVGEYNVDISGDFEALACLSTTAKYKPITKIITWHNSLKSLNLAGSTTPGVPDGNGFTNLIEVPPFLPTSVTSLRSTFTGSANIPNGIQYWNTSNVTNMSEMFIGSGSVNPDISGWNTSNVTDMSGMFVLSGLNPDISTWNTGNVTNMSAMFSYATVFNQDISAWDTSKVTDMRHMFEGATAFNQDLSGWCVPLIATLPAYFAHGTSLPPGNFPVWGTCPP